jgi:hypothetical protein
MNPMNGKTGTTYNARFGVFHTLSNERIFSQQTGGENFGQ